EARLDRFLDGYREGHVARAAAGELVLLEVGDVRQQDVGQLGAGRHVVLDDDDHFAFRVVFELFDRRIRVRVLVDDRIPGVIPEELDWHAELVRPAHAILRRGHFRAALDRVVPREDRDRGFHRVVEGGKAAQADAGAAFARAAVGAGQADVAGD